MFFKYLCVSLFSIVFSGGFAGGLTGCGWIGEKAPPRERLDLTNDPALPTSPSCQIDPDKIKNHFETGVLGENEIIQATECLLSTLHEADEQIEPGKKGELTRREIETLLSSKILGNFEKFQIWIDRLFSARDLLLGERGNAIRFSEIEEIVKRLLRGSQKISELSRTFFSYKQADKKGDPYWELRKKLFSHYIDVIRLMLENDLGAIDHDIPKALLLRQYQLWEGLEEEVGAHYILAGYLANRILFGESENVVSAEQMPEILRYLESVYHPVTEINRHLKKEIWTSKESLSFLYAYQCLFESLLKAFFERELQKIKKEDIIPLLELLHAHIGGKALEFMTAVYEFKTQLLGGDPESLGRHEIKELLKIFDESIDIYGRSSVLFPDGIYEVKKEQLTGWIKVHETDLPPEIKRRFQQMVLDFPRTLYFWTTPFQKTEAVRKHAFMLTQVAFVPIDQIISAYDKDRDGKLSMVPYDPGSPPEIGDIELTSFLSTLQKLLKGLDMLTEGEKKQDHPPHHRIWTNPLDLDTMTLGKVLVLLSDQMLYNSNGDNALDRYEIMEATSFILENSRAVTWFYWDPEVVPFHHQFPNSTEVGLLRKNLVESLKRVPTLQWYFPEAMKAMSEKEVVQYIEMIIQLIGRDHPQIISVKELAVIFMIVRMIEHLFLRFDSNQDGILNKSEIRTMYSHFEPIIEKLVGEYNSQPGAFEKIPVFGIVGKFLSVLLNNFLVPFMNKKVIYRRVFEYSLSFGKLPEFSTDLLFASSKIKSDRLKIASLLTHLMGGYLKKK